MTASATASEERDLVVAEFQTESRENLERFERSLLELEDDPSSAELIRSLFRSVHTIKGSCSFLDLPRIEAVAHAGETVLALARDGALRIDAEITNALLAMVDTIRRLLAQLAATGSEGDLDVSAVVARLERAAAQDRPAEELPTGSDGSGGAGGGGDLNAPAESKIRVDVGLLDRLMNLVGELVLARNQIAQLTTQQLQTALVAPSQRLSLVTTELQEAVMKTRMQPIGNIWSRFPRVVRDLERASGKRVRLVMDGRDTELDKSIIEAIQDPLMHLVRNAVDHGIERPDRRAGKPEQGTLTLRAFHEGGMVNIEILDDGAGIDPAALKQRALDRNLVGSEQIARMSDREALGLIFVPGFTTAERVTNVSGRGVGMDVVKTNVERIGGTVDVHSRVGEGTSIRIKIPLTLAIIPALIVRSGGQSYAIPQASLLEVVRSDQGGQRIEEVHGAPVYRLRGKLLPIAYLHRELRVQSHAEDQSSLAIVVLQADDRSFGLVVDEVSDTEEIVVKPLWKRLKGISCYSGATVMGDGRVALILDAMGLSQRLGAVAEHHDALTRVAEHVAEVRVDVDQAVLCRMADDGRIAIPLSKVARLEELKTERIERVGGKDLVQYRGQILPLLHLSEVLGGMRPAPTSGDGSDTRHVVVCAHGDRMIGFVVESILDITPVKLALERGATRTGVLGSMPVQGRITEFLDVEGVIRSADPTFFAAAPGEA